MGSADGERIASRQAALAEAGASAEQRPFVLPEQKGRGQGKRLLKQGQPRGGPVKPGSGVTRHRPPRRMLHQPHGPARPSLPSSQCSTFSLSNGHRT